MMERTYICLENVIAYLKIHKDKMRREQAVLSADEDEIIRFLKTVPPEDVAPVARGKWALDNWERKWTCLNCMNSFSVLAVQNANEEWDYCPFCGARME